MMRTTTTETTLHDQKNLEKQIERQMGCMAGFLQLFDRNHLLTGKRIYNTKRLPSPPSVADTASVSGRSTPVSKEPETTSSSAVPEVGTKTLTESRMITPPALSVFEIKERMSSSWKFSQAPRLSLDSRATTDANGTLRWKQIRTINQSESPGEGCGDNIEKQRKSTGVIARLMGLDPLVPHLSPESNSNSPSPQLRRSASESRVARDLLQTRLADISSNFQQKPTILTPQPATSRPSPAKCEPVGHVNRRMHQQQQQRNYYDSADFFPEPKPTAVSVYGDIGRRLKMNRIDGSSKDLETLKHILEALQLKGLLHSNKSKDQAGQRNFVYEKDIEPLIVLVKPLRTESPQSSHRLRGGLSPRRNANFACETLLSASPRGERLDQDGNVRLNGRIRNSASPTCSESSVKSINSPVSGMKQLNVETSRNRNASPEQRRISSIVNSPKPSCRRSDANQASSPRNKRSALQEKILSLLSDESSSCNSFQSYSQRVSGSDEYHEGKSLLSRCDQLLQSIADMNSTNTSEQPSPISVLDSSFYKEDEPSSSSPSPILKRSIDFKHLQVDFDDEDSSWTSSAISTVDCFSSDDSDFLYVADVLRAFACLPEDPNLFPLLEKQQSKRGRDLSKTSRLNRKLIFDNVSEILNKNKQLPPWKATSSPHLSTDAPSLPYIWSEFKKLRERDESEQELFQVISGVLKKDLAADSFDGSSEVPDFVLDIERTIFKALIGETIRDLASSAALLYPRRKLPF